MPVSRRSVKLFGERKDLLIQIALRDAGANETAVFDFAKESHRLALRASKFFSPQCLCPSCDVHLY